MAAMVAKICVGCGKDVSGMKRTKDADGNYYCEPCYREMIPDTNIANVVAPIPLYVDSPPSFVCSRCQQQFLAEEVYDDAGKIVCQTCWEISQQFVAATPAEDKVQTAELFPCPVCGGYFAIAAMDQSGVCKRCAVSFVPPCSTPSPLVRLGQAVKRGANAASDEWRKSPPEHKRAHEAVSQKVEREVGRNCTVIFALLICDLLLEFVYFVNPQVLQSDPKGLTWNPSPLFGALGLATLLCAIGSAIYIPIRWRAISALKTNKRLQGLLGLCGIYFLLLLELSRSFADGSPSHSPVVPTVDSAPSATPRSVESPVTQTPTLSQSDEVDADPLLSSVASQYPELSEALKGNGDSGAKRVRNESRRLLWMSDKISYEQYQYIDRFLMRHHDSPW